MDAVETGAAGGLSRVGQQWTRGRLVTYARDAWRARRKRLRSFSTFYVGYLTLQIVRYRSLKEGRVPQPLAYRPRVPLTVPSVFHARLFRWRLSVSHTRLL